MISNGTPSAVKSYFSPSCASRATSPAALWPNRKFSPTTTAAACSRADSTTRTNSSGLSLENSRLNGSTKTASAPRPASSSACRREVVRSGGCEPGRTTSSGCGSKVITTTGRFPARAICTARPTMRWWPRCTPSKTPIVATHLPQSEGTSAEPYQRYTIPRSSFVARHQPSHHQRRAAIRLRRTRTSRLTGQRGAASCEDDERPGLARFFGHQGDERTRSEEHTSELQSLRHLVC